MRLIYIFYYYYLCFLRIVSDVILFLFCNVLLCSSSPLFFDYLLSVLLWFIIRIYKSNRVSSRKVKSTILCHFTVAGREMCFLRMSNVPLMYRSSLTSRYHKHTPILYYCRTNTSESRSSPRTRSPPRSSPPTKTSCLQSASRLISVALLELVIWSLIW